MWHKHRGRPAWYCYLDKRKYWYEEEEKTRRQRKGNINILWPNREAWFHEFKTRTSDRREKLNQTANAIGQLGNIRFNRTMSSEGQQESLDFVHSQSPLFLHIIIIIINIQKILSSPDRHTVFYTAASMLWAISINVAAIIGVAITVIVIAINVVAVINDNPCCWNREALMFFMIIVCLLWKQV